MGKRIFLFAAVLLLVLCNSGYGADFDGLIIDTGDNLFSPALINKIFSESGNTIYDPSRIDKKILVEQGAGEYTPGIDKAKIALAQRGVKNPLIVTATGTLSLSDLIVSNKDAKKIFSANKKTGFLREAKVAFVYGKKGDGDIFSVDADSIILGRSAINENVIKIVSEGLPNRLSTGSDKEKSAIMSAMIISLRDLGETVFKLRKLIAEYEAAEKKGDKKFLDEKKELYMKAKLYTNLFRKFKGVSSFEDIKDFDRSKAYLHYNVGAFTLTSRTLVSSGMAQFDIVILTLRDGRQITVRDGEFAASVNMKHYFIPWSDLKKLGFHGNFEYDSKKEVATFSLTYKR